MHAHFFNARDVHVAGYLAHSIAHQEDETIQKLLKFIAPVIAGLSDAMTQPPDVEREMLCELSNRFVGVSQDAIDLFINQEIDIHLSRLAGLLYEQLTGTRFETLYLAQARTVQPLDFDPSTTKLTKQEILLGLYSGSNKDPAVIAGRPVVARGRNPRGIFSFARFMLSHRYHNLGSKLNKCIER